MYWYLAQTILLFSTAAHSICTESGLIALPSARSLALNNGIYIQYDIEVRTGGMRDARAAGVRRSVQGRRDASTTRGPRGHQTLSYRMRHGVGGG